MALRAVVFDYGMVLTAAPDAGARAQMLRITGLAEPEFDRRYWVDRHAYDEGKLSGLAFWQKYLHDAGLHLGDGAAEELNDWDARYWTTCNTAMVDWQLRLKERGLLTGILSNMGDNVLRSIEREFVWLQRFDVPVWSYRLGIAKPDPAIYEYILQKLGVAAAETLFLDDRQENIDAALALGMKALLFSDVAQLRADLTAQGWAEELGLP